MMYISGENLGQIPTIGYSRHYAGYAPPAPAATYSPGGIPSRGYVVSGGYAPTAAVAPGPTGVLQPGTAITGTTPADIAEMRAKAVQATKNVARGCAGWFSETQCQAFLSRRAELISLRAKKYPKEFVAKEIATYGSEELLEANRILAKIKAAGVRAKQGLEAVISAASVGDAVAARTAANESIKAATETINDTNTLSQMRAATQSGIANQAVNEANKAVNYANQATATAQKVMAAAAPAPVYAAAAPAPMYAAAPAPVYAAAAPAPVAKKAADISSYLPYVGGALLVLMML